MQTTLAELESIKVETALQIIAGVCDYAHKQDGVGFNGPDANNGHRLADKSKASKLTDAERYTAAQMLRKYAGQLERSGYVLDTSDVVENPRTVKYNPATKLVEIRFPKKDKDNTDLMARVKALPGRWFFADDWQDPRWNVPAANAQAVVEALGEEFAIDASVFAALEIASQAPAPTVSAAPASEPQAQAQTYKVELKLAGEQVIVRLSERNDFDKYLVVMREVKAKHGGVFDKGRGGWSFGLGAIDALIEKLIDQFGEDKILVPAQVLEQRAAAKAAADEKDAAAQNEIAALVAAVGLGPDLDAPLPGSEKGDKLFAHQREAVREVFAKRKLIIADEMGLGKTLEALAAAKGFQTRDNARVFVVAPVSTYGSWSRAAELVQVKIEIFSWAKIPTEPSKKFVAIFDEAHNAQMMPKRKKRGDEWVTVGGFRAERMIALSRHENCAAAILLTGTPMKNGRPRDTWTLLSAVDAEIARNRKRYLDRYCGARQESFNQYNKRGDKVGRVTAWVTTGATNMEEWHERTKPVILRRLKKDCVDLPTKMRVLRPVEFDAETAKAYEAMLAKLEQDYDNRVASGLIKDSGWALVLYGHLLHAGSLAKVSTAIEMAQEVLESGGQVVLFTEFTDVAQKLHDALGGEILTGETKRDDRQILIDRFQSGASKVFVVTRAGGVGITLTAAQTVILLDRPWTPGDAEQMEDRCHRIGQSGTVTAYWLQANGADEKRDEILIGKAANIGLALEGKVGTIEFESSAALAEQLLAKMMSKKHKPVEVTETEGDDADADEEAEWNAATEQALRMEGDTDEMAQQRAELQAQYPNVDMYNEEWI